MTARRCEKCFKKNATFWSKHVAWLCKLCESVYKPEKPKPKEPKR